MKMSRTASPFRLRCGSVRGHCARLLAASVQRHVRQQQASEASGTGHEIDWVNPHAFFFIDVRDATGTITIGPSNSATRWSSNGTAGNGAR